MGILDDFFVHPRSIFLGMLRLRSGYAIHRNAPGDAACRFLEVLRKDHGFIQRERVVTYATQPSSARTASRSRGFASQIAAKTTSKVKDWKTPIVQ